LGFFTAGGGGAGQANAIAQHCFGVAASG
jgi:hypothetical protein